MDPRWSVNACVWVPGIFDIHNLRVWGSAKPALVRRPLVRNCSSFSACPCLTDDRLWWEIYMLARLRWHIISRDGVRLLKRRCNMHYWDCHICCCWSDFGLFLWDIATTHAVTPTYECYCVYIYMSTSADYFLEYTDYMTSYRFSVYVRGNCIITKPFARLCASRPCWEESAHSSYYQDCAVLDILLSTDLS